MRNSSKKVMLVHGFEGTPNGSWRPWLMRELEKVGIYTSALSFPKPNNPMLTEWMTVLDFNVNLFPKDKVYLVGHSLGVPAILQYLQKYRPNNIKHVILVSGPIKNEKKKIKNFFVTKLNYDVLKKICTYSVVHGDNDRFVSFKQAEQLAKGLGCKLHKIKNGGHLNEYDGCMKLPVLLNQILG